MVNIADKKLSDIIQMLTEINEDLSVPRNVKDHLKTCITALQDDVELSIKMNKAMQALDEVANDTNLQSYTRTQIWNVASMLEKL